MNNLESESFLQYNLNNIIDYDQLDFDIILSLTDNNNLNNNEYLNSLLECISFNEILLTNDEFNNLLIDISNNNIYNVFKFTYIHKSVLNLYNSQKNK